jgi:hypothetical protein
MVLWCELKWLEIFSNLKIGRHGWGHGRRVPLLWISADGVDPSMPKGADDAVMVGAR